MKKLYIKPIGGMCNRLYCLASAVELARIQNRELIVLWSLKWECNARLSDIMDDSKFEIIYKDEYNAPKRYFDKFLVSLEKYKSNAEVFVDEKMYQIFKEINTMNFEAYFSQFSKAENLYIESCFNFMPKRNFKLPEIFQPNREIAGRVNEELQKIGNSYIGMHIRRTDHQYSKDFSPDEIFINNLSNESKEEKVLLVTDDQSTEDKFVDLFDGRIFTASKDKQRDSLNGVKCAMVNVFLLSKSKKIYGSFNSTFSAFPAEYGEIAISILASENAKL